MYGADTKGKGNMFTETDIEKQDQKQWGNFIKFLHGTVGKALVNLGWVPAKDGYHYRVAGGSFLVYLGNTRPLR